MFREGEHFLIQIQSVCYDQFAEPISARGLPMYGHNNDANAACNRLLRWLLATVPLSSIDQHGW